MDATGINDSGQIVGFGYTSNNQVDYTEAFLIDTSGLSTPEPASVILFGAAHVFSAWR